MCGFLLNKKSDINDYQFEISAKSVSVMLATMAGTQ